MAMYYCRFCGGAPSWNPLYRGSCDDCWEKRVQKLEAEGLTRSDAQGAVEAEDLKWEREQEAIYQGELEAEIRQPHVHKFIDCDEWSRTCVCGAVEGE